MSLAPTLKIPIQGDDFFALLNTNPDEPLSIFMEALQGFRFALDSFLNGHTSHFIPSGFFVDVGLKRIMSDAYLLGSSASEVNSLVYLFLGIGTFLSACFFVSGVFALIKINIEPFLFATPIAIGLFASLQLSTKWSTYDPLVVHPVYGAGITFIGFLYLAVLSRNLSDQVKPWKIALNLLTGTIGVSMYEGFYPFLITAIMINLYVILNIRKNGHENVPWLQSITVIVPLVIVFTTRLYSKVTSTTEYPGTDITFSGKTFVSMITSFRTTAPGGMWNKAWSELLLNKFYMTPLIFFTVIIFSILVFIWYSCIRRYGIFDEPSQNNSIRFLIPTILILTLLISGDFLFSLSKQWSDYLIMPGLTYMNALTSYWGWSIITGILILFATQKIKNKLYLLSLILVLMSWGIFQFVMNTQVAQSEILNPTPFNSDLIRILESEPDLTMEDRCNLLTPFSSNGSLGANWRENINRMYQKRFDTVFCDFGP